jgi:hypothetical protein
MTLELWIAQLQNADQKKRLAGRLWRASPLHLPNGAAWGRRKRSQWLLTEACDRAKGSGSNAFVPVVVRGLAQRTGLGFNYTTVVNLF